MIVLYYGQKDWFKKNLQIFYSPILYQELSIKLKFCIRDKMMNQKRYWQNSEPYHLIEVLIEGRKVIIKDWFDSGKDPNRYDWSFEEFLQGKAKDHITYHLGSFTYQEILEVVKTIT